MVQAFLSARKYFSWRNIYYRLTNNPIGTASANSVESDFECISGVYFHNMTRTSQNVTLSSQKTCKFNNNFDCSETNGYDLPQDDINEV